jgi:murein DD-endopeptidase MepM/ murein hydrolase activator NlpD
MAREKFIYNTQTLRYEKVVETWSQKIIKSISMFSVVIVTGFLFSLVIYKVFPSQREQQQQAEINELNLQIQELAGNIDKMSIALQSIQQRDANAHRMIFGMNPIDKGIWEGGVGGQDRNMEISKLTNSGKLLSSALEKSEKLKRQLALQSESLDSIMLKAKNKEDFWASIPSIKPIREDKLKKNITILSGFGMRVHPIHKVRKMHFGLDFTAPAGTDIQATGKGKVIEIEKKTTGYGNYVTIDHGHGYITLYAHMGRVDVKVGDKVLKGQTIGKVGNTGTSTAPHLHYEVIYMGKKVNPIHYCMDGLTPEEYQELADAAEAMNQSLD